MYDIQYDVTSFFFKILVWHTRTEKADIRNEQKLIDVPLQRLDPRMEV